MRLVQLFLAGGWVMWPLLGCSLLAAGIIIERLVNLRSARYLPPALTTRIETLVEAHAFSRALQACREQPGVYTNLVRTALEAGPSGRDAVREAIDAAGRREIPRVGRYLGALSTIVGVSPLLGLLGTVLGMVQVFGVVAEQGARQASSLSGGIAVALLTTAFGLLIAIPSLVMYNVLNQRAEGIVLDIESRVLLLALRLFRADGSPVVDGASLTAVAPTAPKEPATAGV